ncbi:flagellar hook-length control protein FliK [Porticoccus sp. W117]|uniref:flagellar hook-length control protein FliK n=1 Tax=Porticoccus sp. W117 TaxID=3054777 RepID=UPI002599B665|nr:flagellar hook-length control protein FliK [Porticoccus sp. W117]MDM3869881.1 flagellar hook-length control protein FliK [Porticoccus sp. W117]
MLGEITLTGLTSQGAVSSQLHNWRVGQILEAVVMARPAAERLQLRIGNTQLEARSQAPIQAGDRVLLKVLSTGTTPTLQVVPAAVASGSASELVNQALRQLLPRQLPTEKVLNNLLAILGKPPQTKDDGGSQREVLPARTRGLIETLLARIPNGEKLADHARLKQLVQESGLFNEQRQAQRGGEGAQRDVKQALVQLARQLGVQKPTSGDSTPAAKSPATEAARPASTAMPSSAPTAQAPGGGGTQPVDGIKPQTATQPQTQQQALPAEAGRQANQLLPQGTQREGQLNQSVSQTQMPTVQDLQRQVEGAIARIVSQQVQSLPQPGQEAARWVFELPYRQGDEFHSLPMVIEREASNGDGTELEPGWQVELAFELAGLGQIRAKVLLRGDKVSASLWAQSDETAQLAESELPMLETALEANGLNVGALVCRQGQPVDQQAPLSLASSLLDYHI